MMSCYPTLSTVITLLIAGLIAAPGSLAAGDNKYVGAKDCGRCHKKELIGNQLGVWQKSPHAHALETLKGPKAIEIAKKRGLSKPPDQADECLKCHATAHDVTPAMTAKHPLKLSDGVQCESCHGPGSGYRKKTIMSDHEKAVAKGMWEPGKDEKICLTCHNSESPTWDEAKGFDYEAAKKKIEHPIPPDVKGRYIEAQKAARKAKSGGEDDDEDED